VKSPALQVSLSSMTFAESKLTWTRPRAVEKAPLRA
jgi:hypothetical protein